MCCDDDHLLTCRNVDFKPDLLSKDDINVFGIDFVFVNEIEPHGYVYNKAKSLIDAKFEGLYVFKISKQWRC